MKRESTTVLATGLIALTKAQSAFMIIRTTGSVGNAIIPIAATVLLVVAAVLVWNGKRAGVVLAVPVIVLAAAHVGQGVQDPRVLGVFGEGLFQRLHGVGKVTLVYEADAVLEMVFERLQRDLGRIKAVFTYLDVHACPVDQFPLFREVLYERIKPFLGPLTERPSGRAGFKFAVSAADGPRVGTPGREN